MKISPETLAKLKQYGKMDQTLDEVLTLVLQQYAASKNSVSEDTCQRLKQFSQEGDTLDRTVGRLIDVYEIDNEQHARPTIEIEEQLAEQGILVKDILDIGEDTITLEKNNGTWVYKFKPDEITTSTIQLLTSRKKEGWKTLGLAHFERIGDKLLKLKEVRL